MTYNDSKTSVLLLRILRRNRRRILWNRLLQGLVDGIIFTLLALVAFAAWEDRSPWGLLGWLFTWGGLFLILGLYLYFRMQSGTSLPVIAKQMDAQMGYRDRISSALEFTRSSHRTDFMEAHIRETGAFLEPHQNELMPYPKIDRSKAWALFAALTLISLLPHGDRGSSEQIGQAHQKKMYVQASNDLLSGLKQLRREARDLGLNKLSKMIAAVEKEIQRKIELFTPEELKQPPANEEAMQSSPTTSATQPDTEKESRLETDGTDGTSDKVGEGIRFSNVASYQPVGKFDSFPEEAYAETFGELDQTILDNQLSGQELTNLSQHLEDAAGKLNFLGYRDASPKGDNIMVGSKPRDEYEQALAPLLYKSFSEFLNRYASHVSEKALGKAKLELSKEEQVGGELINISGPPPKDGKFAIRGVTDEPDSKLPKLQGTPDQMNQVASQSASSFAKVSDGKTELGGSGAGVGSSSELGSVPGILPRAEGGHYLPLEGKLGDDAAVIQVIHERGTRQLDSPSPGAVSFNDVLEQYAYGAEAEINSEQVPLHMRDYIREYFRAIRPGQE